MAKNGAFAVCSPSSIPRPRRQEMRAGARANVRSVSVLSSLIDRHENVRVVPLSKRMTRFMSNVQSSRPSGVSRTRIWLSSMSDRRYGPVTANAKGPDELLSSNLKPFART